MIDKGCGRSKALYLYFAQKMKIFCLKMKSKMSSNSKACSSGSALSISYALAHKNSIYPTRHLAKSY